jgi:hypothetical protein
MPFNSASILPTIAFNKDAFPNRQHIASWTKSFSPPKQAQVFSREFPSAISGFRSLCGHQQRSSLSHRAQLDLPFGTFHFGAGSLSLKRTLASTRSIYGASNPGPMLCRERNRSRGIFK